MNDALKVVIEHFHKNCRSDGFLGYIGENKVLFILFNCNTEDTPKVIDRIYSAINKQLLKQRLPRVSVIYGSIAQKLAAQYKV
jgi:GGDEF domain-containing protein